MLRAAFGAGSGTRRRRRGGGGGGAAPTADAAQRPARQPAAPPARRAPRRRRSRRRPAPSTGGFIQADPATNSLIITAPEPLYRQLRAMIDQLDARRAQVYIESLIVEVTRDNAADFGFQWQGLLGNERRQQRRSSAAPTSATGTGNNIIGIDQAQRRHGSATAGVALGDGLNIGLVRNFGGTYGLARDRATSCRARPTPTSLSTPNLITLDNEEAKIVVGQNVPFVTGQFTNTGTATHVNPFQTIERKDVGITLRIKPQIGENGTVRHDDLPGVVEPVGQVAPGTSNAGPSTNKRSIESNVVVDDGQIIVLGGLIEDQLHRRTSRRCRCSATSRTSASCSAARAAPQTRPT